MSYADVFLKTARKTWNKPTMIVARAESAEVNLKALVSPHHFLPLS